jgi:hypothetical protein
MRKYTRSITIIIVAMILIFWGWAEARKKNPDRQEMYIPEKKEIPPLVVPK